MTKNMTIPSQHEIENRLKQFILRKEQEVHSCHRSYEVSVCWTQPFPALHEGFSFSSWRGHDR